MREIKTSTLVESLVAFSALIIIGSLMATKLILTIEVTYGQIASFN